MNILFKLPIFGFLTILAACNAGNKTYIANIQSIQDSLNANRKNLAIDIAPFNSRIEEIETNLTNLKVNYTDSLTLEEGNALDRYKGVMKIYKRNSTLYRECTKEQKILEEQLSNLLADVKSNKITDEEFKNYFSTEKQDVLNLINNTNLIKSSIYEVEPEFRRLSEIVYSMLNKLKD